MSIPGNSMEVIQLDGGHQISKGDLVESVGILYPGERMDIVVTNGGGSELFITLDHE